MARFAGVLVVVTLLLLGAFAGCVERDEPASAKKISRRDPSMGGGAANLTAIEQRLGGRLSTGGDASVTDWFVLSATAGPSGNLTGFRWTLPLGGNIGMRFQGETGAVLEIAPIILTDAKIVHWCLFAFRQHEGKAELLGDTRFLSFGSNMSQAFANWGFQCALTRDTQLKELTVENKTTRAPTPDPRYFFLFDRRLKDLDNVFLVVAAVAERDTEFGLAFRLLTQYPTSRTPPAPTLDVFIDRSGDLRPRAATILGAGNGFQAAMFYEAYGIGAGGRTVATYEEKAGPIVVQTPIADGRPAAAVSAYTLASHFEAPSGWSLSGAAYVGGCAQGRWSMTTKFHGHEMEARSLILQHILCGLFPFTAEALLFGLPFYLVFAGGAGPSATTLELTVANGLLEQFVFVHLALGTPLDVLLDMPASNGEWVFRGLLGNVPP